MSSAQPSNKRVVMLSMNYSFLKVGESIWITHLLNSPRWQIAPTFGWNELHPLKGLKPHKLSLLAFFFSVILLFYVLNVSCLQKCLPFSSLFSLNLLIKLSTPFLCSSAPPQKNHFTQNWFFLSSPFPVSDLNFFLLRKIFLIFRFTFPALRFRSASPSPPQAKLKWMTNHHHISTDTVPLSLTSQYCVLVLDFDTLVFEITLFLPV